MMISSHCPNFARIGSNADFQSRIQIWSLRGSQDSLQAGNELDLGYPVISIIVISIIVVRKECLS